MNALQPWHLIILVLVVVLLFGAKRLPDAARSIGKSMKIFKAETKDMRASGETSDPAAAGTATGAQPASTVAEPDTRQLPQSTPTAPAAPTTPAADPAAATAAQVEQLQRQLDELKRQQAAEQAQRNAG
ncbi:twin arginine-targeting protein translocase, TatA/E family [Saccharomonospora azurea SZMC 14600]|uniref:Sec-independent protein translocase subunit TatA n=1 Tax=Saccharomonospora azurea TaxID=40988 RepID=UPI00023FF6D4|nr:Sec-independent protein translocase subunit TatA [Saccharomonospora azurea]EHK82213.1 twin arginine-targeting protein translocase, TatA/E family [Saccharomonospora azurea SZMC 14600]